MTRYEYLMKAVQDDARRAGERDRLLREARRARRAGARLLGRRRRSPRSIGSICKPIFRHWPWNRHPHPANMAG